MPELPEAEVVVSQLRDRVLGAVLKDCWVGRPDIVRQGIETLDWYRGTNIITIQRRGKSVVLGFSRNHETRYFLAELGMTGLLLFRSPHASYQKHTHLILSLEGGLEPELRYWNPRRFGRIYLFDLTGLERFCHKRFGCDPLTVPWEQFRQLVMGRRGRLKALLMHQQVVAGIKGDIWSMTGLASRAWPSAAREFAVSLESAVRSIARPASGGNNLPFQSLDTQGPASL